MPETFGPGIGAYKIWGGGGGGFLGLSRRIEAGNICNIRGCWGDVCFRQACVARSWCLMASVTAQKALRNELTRDPSTLQRN